MPNRIIKESICYSDSVSRMSWFEECLFVRLIVTVDDFGRMDARPAILKGRMFPLASVTEKQIDEGLRKLASIGIVNLYKVGGKPYLCLPTWSEHQTPRAKESKYPAPDEADDDCEHLQANENICTQMNADAPDIRYSDSINDIRYSGTGNKRAGAFVPPTLEEVEAYCKERNSPVNPKQFYEFFSTPDDHGRTWIDSKGKKVTNWKQKLLTWEKYDGGKKKTHMPSMDYGDTSDKQEQMRRMLAAMEAKNAD